MLSHACAESCRRPANKYHTKQLSRLAALVSQGLIQELAGVLLLFGDKPDTAVDDSLRRLTINQYSHGLHEAVPCSCVHSCAARQIGPALAPSN